MAQAPEQINCIILTLRNENIVVPSVAVADIVSAKSVSEIPGAPNWLLGNLSWRGAEVPVVSFETAGGHKGYNLSMNTQVAVLYTVSSGDEQTYPYIGVVVSGVPHTSAFTREQIKVDAGAKNNNPMVAEKVRINGAAVSILDISNIESMVADAVAA